ncbi:psbP domain-containing protein 6, chloroplastic [Fagus crenata]
MKVVPTQNGFFVRKGRNFLENSKRTEMLYYLNQYVSRGSRTDLVADTIYFGHTRNVQPYQFILPPTWKQLRIANILSGNYCQPKCAEPWVEVKFKDEKQGKVQVVASPLIRLTNKPNSSIEEIGSPEKLIASLGPFVTGNTYDPDELLETSVEKRGDQTYYKYVLETPFALTGSHNLAKATAKGNTVVLFVASANDKQWQASEKTLKAMLDSFQV